MQVKRIVKWLFGFVLALCVCGGLSWTAVSADVAFDNVIQTEIKEINNENLDHGNSFIMVLTVSDYMTATEWNNMNYKWLNDEFGSENRETIDYAENNVANAWLDQNLSSYNFTEMILIDGQTLAEFGQTHPYKLIANKRTRVHTISIDFAANVLQNVELVEIKEGCQLPTLAYAYRGDSESSCLEVAETKKYTRADGVWVEYFEGYAEGVEYQGNENTFRLNTAETYKGNPATPLNGYTGIFMEYDVQGEKLTHKILVSGPNTVKGNIMVLGLVHPIKASEFAQINLRVYINHQVNVSTYNADDISAGSLGTALETFTVGGGMFSYLSLTSAFYSDANGMVETIVFRFDQDCQLQYNANGEELYDGQGRLIRDTFHFVSFNVSNPDLITKDSFTVKENGEHYEAVFRFNKAGKIFADTVLDTEKVALNGLTLAELGQKCPDMTASWVSVKGIYQINVTLPKAYTGEGCVKNPEYDFANNHMGVKQGLTFPNGDILDKGYACHIYAGEKILDVELDNGLQATRVNRTAIEIDEDSQNITFFLFFDRNITSSPYYHVCETEHWRSNDLYKHDNTLYNAGISDVFVRCGYKSSLMNNVIVNGKTIGDWHAFDSKTLTNVQVHYGKSGMNSLSIVFAKSSPNTYEGISALLASGEGIEIEVKSGLRFMTNVETKETQTFLLKDGKLQEQVEQKGIAVYFNGVPVSNGDLLMVQTTLTETSLAVEGVENYDVTTATADNTTTYTITYGDGETFIFSVKTDIVESTAPEKGCNSAMGAIVVAVAVMLIGGAVGLVLCIKGKRNTKQPNAEEREEKQVEVKDE